MGIIHTARKNIVGELIRKKTQLKTEQIAREEMRSRQLNTSELMEVSLFCFLIIFSKISSNTFKSLSTY